MEDGTPFQFGGGEKWRDPFPMYANLRSSFPALHVEDGDFVVLSRMEDVLSALLDPATFSSAQGLTLDPNERAATGLDSSALPIVMLDPPEHTAFRRLLNRGFSPRRAEELEPAIRTFAIERLEELRSQPEGDFVKTLAKPLPSMVVAHYLGVPIADRPQFDRWTDAIVAANSMGGALSAGAAVGELVEYFLQLIERRRSEPGDDTLSDLLQLEREGHEVPILQVLGYAFTMVAGGNDTATGLLGGALQLLMDNPDARQTLISEPTKIRSSIDEFLRLVSPVQGLARTATTERTLHGTTIREGQKVFLLYGAANRDEEAFGERAAALDLDRNIEKMVGFGFGRHHCLGAAVARLQARVVLEELLARCPNFTVDASRGTFAEGAFVRRFTSLPFRFTD
ncbi:MAG: cytochrome P450 [Actinomycetota bacterium]